MQFLKSSTTLLFSFFIISTLIGQQNYAVSEIPDSLLKKAYSVVRVDKTNVVIKEDKVTYNVRRAITVLNEKHKEKLLFAKQFDEKSEKISNIKVNIYDKDGKEIKKVKSKEISDQYTAASYELISSSRIKYYEHSTPNFPVTLEYQYTFEDSSPMLIESWILVQGFNTSVQHSEYTILNNSTKKLKIGEQNVAKYRLEDENLHYKATNVKPFTKEKMMPSFRKWASTLSVGLDQIKYHSHHGTVNTWSEFGNWVKRTLYNPKNDIDKNNLKAEISSFIGDEQDKFKIAKMLYEYVQENTRYVLISLNDGGLSPLSTSTVHEKKYGDCKALSFYYFNLVKMFNIDAELVLIKAGNIPKGPNETIFTHGLQFNHMISKLTIDNEDIWVDCTSSTNPFSYISEFNQGRRVLILNDDNSYFEEVPKRIDKTEYAYNFDLLGNDMLNGEIIINTMDNGVSSKLNQIPNMDQEDSEDYQRESLMAKFKNPEIKDYTYLFDSTDFTFQEKLDVLVPNAVESMGDYITIKLKRGDINPTKFKKDSNRKWDVYFPVETNESATWKVKVPEGYEVRIEEDINLSTPYGTYSFESVIKDNTLNIKRKLVIYNGTYPNTDFNKIKNFHDKVRKAELRKITFKKL